jgi:signal transduction histidine kinase
MVYGKLLNARERDSLQRRFSDIKFDSITPNHPLPQNLVLPYLHNRVSFDFGAIETNRNFMVRYKYILEGYDKEWSPVTEKTSASFSNINEGEYTFKLIARSPEGVWSEPILYSFKVLPPLWKTGWAYIFYTFLIALLLYTLIKRRTKTLQQEKVKLEEKVVLRTLQLEHKSSQLEHSLENLKTTQAQLIQSEKMASLGELTAGIAHEIQNPLNFVNNFSEVSLELADELKKEATEGNRQEVIAIAGDIAGNLQKVVDHGKRADAIVKGMLQHSRVSAGKKEPTDINALADEYLRLSYHGLRAKDKDFNANFKTDFDESIDPIDVVPQDIGRVLLNLYNNAFYAVNEKKRQLNGVFEPTVLVSTKRVGDKVEIKVKDNGNGIPQKVVDKIYQPFFTTKPTGQGTGLGLSLSYDIVKAHGGEIKVETREGEYTEFKMVLPGSM